MTEVYIHFIWKLKRLPFHELQTTKGKSIRILNNGTYNISESGPDFFNARMYYDHMEWAGQVEMHVKSSDWYLHGHHRDEGYNNVMLHVVYEHDREVIVNGAELPTIEIKHLIDEEHYQNWEQFAKAMKAIPCEDSIHQVDPIFLKAMFHRAVTDRFDRKVNQLLYLYDGLDNQAVLYNFIARAFGTKVNAIPFELLTNQLPLVALKRLNKSLQRKLLLKASGLYPEEQIPELPDFFSTQQLDPSVWKRKGLRPPSFPEKRILQFSAFVAGCDFDILAEYLSPEEAYKYIGVLTAKMNQSREEILSENLVDQLLINAIFPYFWFKSLRTGDEQLQEFVVALMEQIRPEDNFILKKWNKIGVHAISAYESQALIELYNEYCSRKKCLDCQIGVKLLNR